MTCPRLAAHLQNLKRQSRHLDAEDLNRAIENHKRWHVNCFDYQPTPGLARDPQDDPKEAP